MYIFLDEAGDLGFDLTKKGTSKFFVMTLLISEERSSIKTIKKAITKALTKINHKQKICINELKGAHTPIVLKKHFLEKIGTSKWQIYTIIIDKKSFHKPKYMQNPNHLYNYIAGCLINKIELLNSKATLSLVVDKCKSGEQIHEFNRHIEEMICSKLKSTYDLTIRHKLSYDDKLLQAVDLFCFGVFAKYENDDCSWYSCFQDRVIFEGTI